jgi:hypothetical protein
VKKKIRKLRIRSSRSGGNEWLEVKKKQKRRSKKKKELKDIMKEKIKRKNRYEKQKIVKCISDIYVWWCKIATRIKCILDHHDVCALRQLNSL